MTPYYETDNGKLYNGDCLEILSGFENESVEIAVTSPNYNRITEWTGGGPNTTCRNIDDKYEDWYKDKMPEDKYQEWQRAVISQLIRVCRSSIFYNHKIRYAWRRRRQIYHPVDWLREFPIWCEIIWDRCGGQGGGSRRVIIADERIYQIKRPVYFNNLRGYTSVWRFPPCQASQHPCPFPIELPTRCIEITTVEDDVVLDPFLGSGTTAVACERLGRRWIGIDLSKEYCDIARKRIEKEAAQGKLALT